MRRVAPSGSAPNGTLSFARRMRQEIESLWFGSGPHLSGLARQARGQVVRRPRDPRPVRQQGVGGVDSGTADPFSQPSRNRAAAVALHRFDWMPGLIEQDPQQALDWTRAWQQLFGRWNRFSWSAPVLERRVFQLACHLLPLVQLAGEAQRSELDAALVCQTRQLLKIRSVPSRLTERTVVAALASGTIEGHLAARMQSLALARLAHLLPMVVMSDGGHASRSPQAGLELLLDLMCLADGLALNARPCPDVVSRAIDRLTGATRFFTLTDGRLAAFHGGGPADTQTLAVLPKTSDLARLPGRAPHAGYQRLQGPGLCVLVDTAGPARGVFSDTACQQPMALEISAGADRLVVNSGWTLEAGHRPGLREAAAASTVSLAGAPADTGRRRTDPLAKRQEVEQSVLLELETDAGMRDGSMVLQRRLYLGAERNELRGEDGLLSRRKTVPGRMIGQGFVTRFHLDPTARGELASDGRAVLITGASGQTWWLRHDAEQVRLVPSTRIEAGRPLATVQIELDGRIADARGGRVRWELSPS